MTIDRAKLNTFFQSLEKEYGKGSVYSLDSAEATLNIPRWSTGIEDLDEILGGGMPFGRIVEIFGCESAGKSSMAHHLTAQHEIAINVPVEGSLDPQRAKVFGNKKGQLYIRRANTGEQCFELIDNACKAGIPIIVIDSVPAMITENEFEETDYTKEMQPARIAALMSKRLPKTTFLAEQNNTTLIFINQLRDTMNKTFFTPDDHTPGGRALKFYCSIRLKLIKKDSIKIPNKNPKDTAKDKEVGQIVKVKIIKNKVHNAKGECEIPLFFDRGFVSHADIEPIRKELMEAQRKKYKAGKDDAD